MDRPRVIGTPVAPALPLCTARLTLRPWTRGDRPALVALLDDPAVHRFLYSTTLTPDEVHDHLERRLRPTTLRQDGDALRLLVELTATGDFLGEVVLMLTAFEHAQAEVGYVFTRAAAGHGYATEAARALVDAAFAAGAHRVAARADARNTRSIRVMERLGMRHEALLRENEFVKGEWTDEHVAAVLAHEWRATPSG